MDVKSSVSRANSDVAARLRGRLLRRGRLRSKKGDNSPMFFLLLHNVTGCEIVAVRLRRILHSDVNPNFASRLIPYGVYLLSARVADPTPCLFYLAVCETAKRSMVGVPHSRGRDFSLFDFRKALGEPAPYGDWPDQKEPGEENRCHNSRYENPPLDAKRAQQATSRINLHEPPPSSILRIAWAAAWDTVSWANSCPIIAGGPDAPSFKSRVSAELDSPAGIRIFANATAAGIRMLGSPS